MGTHGLSGQLWQGLTALRVRNSLSQLTQPRLFSGQSRFPLSCHHQTMESRSAHALETPAVLLTRRPLLDSLLRRPSTGAVQKA